MERDDFELLLGRIEELENKLDGQAEAIAQKAAEKVWDLIYVEVGRNTLKGAAWIVGLGLAAVFAWLAGTGRISLK
jgi:tetrahydromethanopterin S-methyltransferase subunit G